MPRGLDAEQAYAAGAPEVYLALLVEMQFDPEPMRLWSGLGDLAVGNATFTGAGTLLGVSEVEEAAEVRAAVTTLSLSGITGEVIDAALDVDWQGKPATVSLALLTAEGGLLGDPIQVLAGRMDTLSWREGEEAAVSLSVENRLVDLDRPRVRRYTDADQQDEYPGDRGFEFVASLVEKEITWGRR
jgi:hypothetical protein